MGLRKNLEERIERGRKRYRAGKEKRSEEAYLRDVDELKRLRKEEKMLKVRVQKEQTKASVGRMRRGTNPIRRWGGQVVGYLGQGPPPPAQKRTQKKKAKKKKSKPREQPRERKVARDAFGVPL